MYQVKDELPHDRAARRVRNRNKTTNYGKRYKRMQEKQRDRLPIFKQFVQKVMRRTQGRGA